MTEEATSILYRVYRFCSRHISELIKDIFIFGVLLFVVDIVLHLDHATSIVLNYFLYIAIISCLGIKYTIKIAGVKTVNKSIYVRLIFYYLFVPLAIFLPFSIFSIMLEGDGILLALKYTLSTAAAATLLVYTTKRTWKILIPREHDSTRTLSRKSQPVETLFVIYTFQILCGLGANKINSYFIDGNHTTAYLSFFLFELFFIANIILFFIISCEAFLYSREIAKI